MAWQTRRDERPFEGMVVTCLSLEGPWARRADLGSVRFSLLFFHHNRFWVTLAVLPQHVCSVAAVEKDDS